MTLYEKTQNSGRPKTPTTNFLLLTNMASLQFRFANVWWLQKIQKNILQTVKNGDESHGSLESVRNQPETNPSLRPVRDTPKTFSPLANDDWKAMYFPIKNRFPF